jgi:hypothetical protein
MLALGRGEAARRHPRPPGTALYSRLNGVSSIEAVVVRGRRPKMGKVTAGIAIQGDNLTAWS